MPSARAPSFAWVLCWAWALLWHCCARFEVTCVLVLHLPLAAAVNSPVGPREGPLSEESDSPRPDPDGHEPELVLVAAAAETPGPRVHRGQACETLHRLSGLSWRVIEQCSEADLQALARLCLPGNLAGMPPATRSLLCTMAQTPLAEITWVQPTTTRPAAHEQAMASSSSASFDMCLQALENRLSELEGVVGTVVTSSRPLRPILTRVRDVELELASRTS